MNEQKRKKWTAAEKLRIVLAGFAPTNTTRSISNVPWTTLGG